jgi:phthiodiolone/phenolphthiodiolone dimycocerosates ketoreductase
MTNAPPGRLTMGAPASALPDVDPIDDVIWADAQPEIDGVWFIDHLLGWVTAGVDPDVVAHPHAVMDPFALMGAAAKATSRVQIGVAVTDPFRRSPAALAQAALTIGWLGGRPMALGLGTGGYHNLEPFGLGRKRKMSGFERACEDITGYFGRGKREPLGIGSAADGRLYVAAHGPKTIDLAARFGDGWLPAGLTPKPFASCLRLLRERAEVHGRDPDAIRPTLLVWAALAETRAASAAMLERPFVRAVSLYNTEAAFQRYGVSHPIKGEYMPDEMTVAEAVAAIRGIPPEVARDTILSGSIDDVRERVGEYEEAGCQHLIVYDIGRYTSPEGVDRTRACLKEIAKR